VQTDLSPRFLPRALLELKGAASLRQAGTAATLSKGVRARARTRVSFVRKSRPAGFPGTGSPARRATDLHFHGARLANAYCIYLLASKVNLPAPVHESHAHIHGRVSAGRAHTRTRPRARTRASQRLRAPRASPGAQEVSRARARARGD